MSAIVFHSQPDVTYLAVGTGVNVSIAPRKCRKGYIHLYKFSEDGTSLELMYKVFVYRLLSYVY